MSWPQSSRLSPPRGRGIPRLADLPAARHKISLHHEHSPVAVFLRKGAGKDFVINLLLWILLFGLGGIIHAFWVLTRK